MANDPEENLTSHQYSKRIKAHSAVSNPQHLCILFGPHSSTDMPKGIAYT